MYMTNIHISMYLWYTAATNRFEDIDPAMVRRFESRIYVGVPEHDTRVAMVLILCIHVCMAKYISACHKYICMTYIYIDRSLCLCSHICK
jgi:SpoVK/Ycf46/Vps4 family AAA+-type ATPase